MPRPGLPLTPGSSTDLKGKDGANHIASLHLAFELPPPAIHDAARTSPGKLSPGSSAHHGQPHHQHMSPPSYPMQAAETVKARRRSSAATKETKDSNAAFALPPPPTRSRKIIQMKPRQEDAVATAEASASKESTGKGGGASKAAKTTAASASGSGGAAAAGASGKSGKKQPSATSAAGRKIARKTAHSLIERRRRSKMNEEFAVLKNMIPACTGDMHKLAILQASIEYIRYLEDCVSQLKDQHDGDHRGDFSASGNPLPSIREFHPTFHGEPGDVEMSDSEAVSPTFTARPDHHYQAHQHQPSVSPALHAQDARPRHHSYSSATSAVGPEYRHHSFTLSATPSPAFGPQRHGPYARSSTSTTASTVTSPALNPQTELDQEATAALLMLNNDRRGTAPNARGLSVRDLLSG
ncbi:Helix-loop-helix DNA-binding protein [Akanthomyces lecanii RCEF 1005]|uniref:Helix-loop-helix DNA-binding protein n=1 Tax=Akanthomyces lecanii RCEF 1005 TaxID=1081108 RepID=A0A168IM08_CORDF|nr:Helix-loop-helix DNA-binding protein [Akanthomyces lecanii RCEF 1005]